MKISYKYNLCCHDIAEKLFTLQLTTTHTPYLLLNTLHCPLIIKHIDGVMVSLLTSSVVDPGFELQSGQTKHYNIGICCFSSKHAVLRSKSKDWLARNQDHVYEWNDMSSCELLFQ